MQQYTIVGYTGSKIPLASDELTLGIRIITAVLYCGLPILGWLCTIFAMKKFSLTKEEMEKIQKEIADEKAKQMENQSSNEQESEKKEEIIEESIKEEIQE